MESRYIMTCSTKQLLEQLRGRRVMVVHHWDADGVASAAIAVRSIVGHGGVITGVHVPTIGRYRWEAIPAPDPGAETVLILDYGIPGTEYENYYRRHIRESTVDLVVIDHHRVELPREGFTYCNPVASGEGGEEEYPSASLLLANLLERNSKGDSLLAALGAIGDLAPFYDSGRSHPGLEAAGRLAEKAGVPLSRLRLLAESIDSCYRLLDTDCLQGITEEAVLNPYRLLNEPLLEEALQKASTLLEEALGRLREVGEACGAATYMLEMDAVVTSAVGRRLAARYPEGAIALVHHIPSQGGGFIYVRSISRSLSWLHEEARRRGHRAGGKTHVAVIEYEGSPEEALGVLRSLCGTESG